MGQNTASFPKSKDTSSTPLQKPKTCRLDHVNISNKTGYVRIMYESGTLVQPLLQWKISNY